MHALARPRQAPLAARAAQFLTIGAFACGGLAYAAPARPADSTVATVDSTVASSLTSAAFTAEAQIASRADADRASRSTTGRSPVRRDPDAGPDSAAFALVAPRTNAPTRPASFGVLGVKAVAKPEAVAVSTSGDAGGAPGASAAAGGGSGSGSTTAYAAAGAALGLVPTAAAVYSAIRSTFGITNIGGYRPGDWGDHGTGHAVDVMITSAGQGDAVASFAIANAGRLRIKYVIWQQRIWMPSTGVWRMMEDRGSPTQNHMDHVHISVY